MNPDDLRLTDLKVGMYIQVGITTGYVISITPITEYRFTNFTPGHVIQLGFRHETKGNIILLPEPDDPEIQKFRPGPVQKELFS